MVSPAHVGRALDSARIALRVGPCTDLFLRLLPLAALQHCVRSLRPARGAPDRELTATPQHGAPCWHRGLGRVCGPVSDRNCALCTHARAAGEFAAALYIGAREPLRLRWGSATAQARECRRVATVHKASTRWCATLCTVWGTGPATSRAHAAASELACIMGSHSHATPCTARPHSRCAFSGERPARVTRFLARTKPCWTRRRPRRETRTAARPCRATLTPRSSRCT